MIFLLDNHDSYTYNLMQYLGELGERPEVAKNDEISIDVILDMQPSAIVFSPGPGRPEHAGIMPDLLKKFANNIPILGVCLGHQAIAQLYGGDITYAPTIMHGKTSQIYHDDSTLFHGIPSPFEATRYHSLIIHPESLPEDLQVTAWTEDKSIMAIQHRHLPLYGVQFHPESILTTCGHSILKNFLHTLSIPKKQSHEINSR